MSTNIRRRGLGDPVPSVWEILSQVDVSEHTETKGGLTYLSWPWAWKHVKDRYPDATFEKHVFNGVPPMCDARGFAWVMVTVTIQAHPVTEILPVMDHHNKAIQNPDAFAVNTALQRCMVKAIAFHGLGHHIYAGEDTPPGAAEPRLGEVIDPTPAPAAEPIIVVDIEDTLDLPPAKKESSVLMSLRSCRSKHDIEAWERDNDAELAWLEGHSADEYEKIRQTRKNLKESRNG